MKELVSSCSKHTAFCQTIVQASRPRTAILSIPLALTISIDICGSSELIIEAAWLGFCLWYDELLWFKHWINFGINCSARMTIEVATNRSFCAISYRASKLQALHWSMLDASELEPTECGWRLTDDGLQLVMTSQAAEILNVVRCKCKTACTSSLSSFRRNGIYCVSACGNCHGDSSVNIDKDTQLHSWWCR